jgi:hypothetical protein
MQVYNEVENELDEFQTVLHIIGSVQVADDFCKTQNSKDL